MGTIATSVAGTTVSATPSQQYLTTEPSAARIADVAASQPYSAITACMDIVDNSIEHGARGISVTFDMSGKLLERIVFADNGTGISAEIINEVLRAGSRTKDRYRATSLSRYGIGLKGAGFSLANRIVVLTRNEDGDFFRRAIDLRRIEETDQWQQEVWGASNAEVEFFDKMLGSLPGEKGSNSGTVVILEQVKLRTRDLSKLKTDLVRATGEAYGKFLGGPGEAEYRRLAIDVGGVAVAPVDPLHRENKETLLIVKREKISFDDGTSAFFTAVSLPHPHSQAPDIQKAYRYQTKTQGIYVYRNGRLIRSAETFDLFSRDFHLNAFRAELEYSTEADVHFPVDVAKSTIRLDEDAAQKLQPLVQQSTRTASTLWREKDVLTKDDIADLFDESNRLIGSRANLLLEAVNKRKGEMRVPKRKLRTLVTPPVSPTADGEAPEDAGNGKKAGTSASPTSQAEQLSQAGEGPYLRPVDSLPGGILYRPRLDGEISGVIVEVNLSHPFSKAVFDVSSVDKQSVPRRATTAVQQLLYVLGYCEFTMVGDQDEADARLFEQFRRYVSMNIDALLE